jgi:hypothetical protein
MNVIPPLTITDALLTSSTVSEPDAGSPTTEMVFNAGSPSTSYALGAIVIDTTAHLKYESLAAANTAQLSDAAQWLLLGPTNKWAMFDTLRSTATIAPSPLTVVITPGVRIDALALLGLVADSVTVSVDSAIGSPSMNYYTHIEASTGETSLALFDLPPFTNGIITVTLTAASGNVECGALVIGMYQFIGDVQATAVDDVLNFSTVTRDFAGATNTLVQRRNVPKTQQQLLVDKTRVNAVRLLRDSLNAIPAVWSGIDDDTDGYFDALLILGFYKQFSIDLAFPDQALITLELEEI